MNLRGDVRIIYSNCIAVYFPFIDLYIEIDSHFIHHHLLQGTLTLQSVSFHDQLADIFTKPFPPVNFRTLPSKLKMVSLKP